MIIRPEQSFIPSHLFVGRLLDVNSFALWTAMETEMCEDGTDSVFSFRSPIHFEFQTAAHVACIQQVRFVSVKAGRPLPSIT